MTEEQIREILCDPKATAADVGRLIGQILVNAVAAEMEAEDEAEVQKIMNGTGKGKPLGVIKVGKGRA